MQNDQDHIFITTFLNFPVDTADQLFKKHHVMWLTGVPTCVFSLLLLYFHYARPLDTYVAQFLCSYSKSVQNYVAFKHKPCYFLYFGNSLTSKSQV